MHLRRVALLSFVTCACACASYRPPSVTPLCGTWTEQAPSSRYESWSREGRGLIGEGGEVLDSGELVASEHLQLRADRRGHVYVASPGHAIPTEFVPVDPARSRFGASAPATATIWLWANYDHDFPQELRYVLLDDGRLQVTISGPEPAGGRSAGWTFVRAADCTI